MIDVGTNSVKFHIGERDIAGRWAVVVDRAEVTRLGEGLAERGEIGPEPLERTAAAIAGMVDEARSQGAVAIVAVGTAGLRSARNRDAVVAAIRARTGVTIRVISGEEEARLAYLAAVSGNGSHGICRRLRHGWRQLAVHVRSRCSRRRAFQPPVGAVRYTERFGLADAVGPAVLEAARAAIAADLARIDGRPKPDALVAMGGAVTNIAAVKHGLATYDPEVVHQTVLDRDEIDRQIELYRSRDADERRTVVGLQAQRADVILAGACIVREVMEKLDQATLTVCDRGLRHGLLVERFG